MEKENMTPASCMDEMEYREYIIENYGHIKGLAKTLLALRKQYENGALKKNETGDESETYRLIENDIDKARKLLNKLHVRIAYAGKEKSFSDIPYYEIQDLLSQVIELLVHTEAMYVSVQAGRQRDQLMLDYIEY